MESVINVIILNELIKLKLHYFCLHFNVPFMSVYRFPSVVDRSARARMLLIRSNIVLKWRLINYGHEFSSITSADKITRTYFYLALRDRTYNFQAGALSRALMIMWIRIP